MKASRRTVKLMAFNKNEVFRYQGDCKLIIDKLSQTLKIQPKISDLTDISALYKWKFIQKRNLLFIFADIYFQDLVLIFSNENICKKVHEKIYDRKEADFINQEQFRHRLLIPIFQCISRNDFSTKIKRIIIDWINMHEQKEKKQLMQFLKGQEKHEIMDTKNVISARKRRFSEMEDNENAVENVEINVYENSEEINEIHLTNQKSKIKIIKQKYFKIINFKIKKGYRRKLLVFTSAEQKNCYEYNYFPTKELFYHRCRNSGRGYKAAHALDDNGNEIIKLQRIQHICHPKSYISEKYLELKIIKKPDYEILENCSTHSKRVLIIFNSSDKSQCYEYYWILNTKKFVCSACILDNKQITAEICHENTVEEYIRLLTENHICEIRKYNPKKFNEIREYVLSPNFEIQTKLKDDGTERKTLIIFKENDRSLCYTYYYDTNRQKFLCNGCIRLNKYVSAKISANFDGIEYVILSNVKHICAIKNSQNEIILYPPKIKFIETNNIQNSRLFIFDSSNPKFCYIFGKNQKRYSCLGCNQVVVKSSDAKDVTVTAYLHKDNSNSEYYVKMKDGQKHVCKTKLYEPEKYESKILQPKTDYIFIRQKSNNNKNSIFLVIFDPENKNLCYKYCYDKSKKIFQCQPCKNRKNGITAKLHKNSAGSECIIINQKKHTCTAIKYSTIIKSNITILEKSGLPFEEQKQQNKVEEIDENRIIRQPNFKLQKNARNVPDRRLFVFENTEKNIGYEYAFVNRKFQCKKCDATAKVHIDTTKNDNEKYIILDERQHTCEAVKYEDGKSRIDNSNFMIFNQHNKNKPTKLVIFTSPSKELCYEYTWCQDKKLFRCMQCHSLKKIIHAKVIKDDENDDKEYVEISMKKHFCQPKKFIFEEFQPKIISQSGFKLSCNKNGKLNAKLIIFDAKKSGYGFEYFMTHNTIFQCNGCKVKKKRVTAKLYEKENDEKYLELSLDEHICKSVKYQI